MPKEGGKKHFQNSYCFDSCGFWERLRLWVDIFMNCFSLPQLSTASLCWDLPRCKLAKHAPFHAFLSLHSKWAAVWGRHSAIALYKQWISFHWIVACFKHNFLYFLQLLRFKRTKKEEHALKLSWKHQIVCKTYWNSSGGWWQETKQSNFSVKES